MKRRVTFGGVEVFNIPNRADVEHEVPDWMLYADAEDGAADDEADGADVADVYEDSDDDVEARVADCLIATHVTLARLNAFKNRAPPSYALDGEDGTEGAEWHEHYGKRSPRLAGAHAE